MSPSHRLVSNRRTGPTPTTGANPRQMYNTQRGRPGGGGGGGSAGNSRQHKCIIDDRHIKDSNLCKSGSNAVQVGGPDTFYNCQDSPKWGPGWGLAE